MSYNPILVFISLLISILACWTALEISCRVHAQPTRLARASWLGCGACVMGLGIWAMHYVGMLALQTGIVILYDWPTVLLSLAAAVGASGAALLLSSRPTLGRCGIAGGGLTMGAGIGAMHYIGMAAMRMPCRYSYSLPLVALSIVLAVCISAVALHFCSGAKQDTSCWSRKRFAVAVLLGLAVPIMHYVGMAAMRLNEGMAVPAQAESPRLIHVSQLGIAVLVGAVFLFVCIALLLASYNRNALATAHKLECARTEHEQLTEHQQRLIKAYRQNGVGAWEWNPGQDAFSIDSSIFSMYAPDWPVGTAVPRAVFLKMVHPDDRAVLRQRWEAALVSGTHYENEYRIVQQTGEVRRCRSIATIQRHPDGTAASVLGMSWDITAEHQQQQDYAEQARRFHLTLESIGEGILYVDADGTILYSNPAACQLTGWPGTECIGKQFTEVFTAQDEATGLIRRCAIQRCRELGGELLTEDAILLSRDGARYNIRKHLSIVDARGSAVIAFQDITRERQHQRELEVAATHDHLTGLPNRVAFERLLRQVWDNEREPGRTHCLVLLDLDRFKLVNDTAGHLAGDAMLQRLVHTLKPLLRSGDCLARMGGDEFLLLLRDSAPDKAAAFCQMLLTAIEDIHFTWQHRAYAVTASFGLAFFDHTSTSHEALTSHADVALFTAKRNGRNRLVIYESTIGEAAGSLREMEVVTELRAAITENRFELYAQPIVALNHAGAPPYFELLLRMRDRRGELVPPSAFIPAAECYGLMQVLDRWVIEHALNLYSRALPSAHGHHFAINVSADSLSDPTLWNFVYEQFRLAGVPFSAITFEVTESGLIRNFSTAREFLSLARAAGCRIALDDFGTGMSSLSYLKQFSLDVIKIDGTFIRSLVSTPLDRSIVRAISQIAHSINAQTVAECAEDMATVELLRSLDVDYVQGWATGKPQPLTSVLTQAIPMREDNRDQFADIGSLLSRAFPLQPNANPA